MPPNNSMCINIVIQWFHKINPYLEIVWNIGKVPSIFMILTLDISETKEVIDVALSSMTNCTPTLVFSPGKKLSQEVLLNRRNWPPLSIINCPFSYRGTIDTSPIDCCFFLFRMSNFFICCFVHSSNIHLLSTSQDARDRKTYNTEFQPGRAHKLELSSSSY